MSMNRWVWVLGFFALALTAVSGLDAKGAGSGSMVGHMVYFSLNEPTSENIEAVIASCHKHLTGHDGTVFYAAGVLAEDLNRPVNDRAFQVALQLVFENKSAHDQYQEHPRHLEFIKENQAKFKTVRVFDSYVGQK
jgi:hypothetical protein